MKRTALMWAVIKRDFEIVQSLIEAGADLTITDNVS